MSEFALESMIVGDILARWPDSADAFNQHKMACPGCVMAPFMTLAEACDAYGLDLDEVADTLRQTIGPDMSSQQESMR
ncbi:MAG: DUF1858 domain-containing protein [Rhodospirillales bacterium]|nr:DUF1858 domain-containing protein [Rhodospirillales bacterium]MBO6788377.1 DUF1858 domain-containing protein [Rhodospirillales bacterium]